MEYIPPQLDTSPNLDIRDIMILKGIRDRATYREIAKMIGVHSTNSVTKRVNILVENNYVIRTGDKKARSLMLTESGKEAIKPYAVDQPG